MRALFIHWVLSCALLSACTTGPHRSGFPTGSLRFDTETTSRMRHAASLRATGGVATSSVVKASASRIARLVPAVLLLMQHDEAALDQMETFLLECVQRAERDINAERFGHDSPTSAECKTVVGVDKCGRPITQAMALGTLKHARALACMQDILRELWPRPVSIEQRYRYYRHAKLVETISPSEEQRLLEKDCAGELRGTFKPDVVLHADYSLLRAVMILELKFLCPTLREPRWATYGDTSAYAGSHQGQIYKEALGGTALILSPTGVFE